MKAHLVHAPLKSASHTGHRAARCCRIRYSHCTIERSFTETTWESFLAKVIFRARLWFIGMKVIFARSEISLMRMNQRHWQQVSFLPEVLFCIPLDFRS